MKMASATLFGRLYGGLAMAVLASSISFAGSRIVRAEDAGDLTPSLQEMIVDPIMKTFQGFEARLTGLESTLGAMAESFSSRRVVAQVLCVSDETGAQTCITKAQLDLVLSGIARAEINQHAAPAVSEAKAVPAEEEVEAIVTKDAAAAPDPAGAGEKSTIEQEPEHTGSIQSASSGLAIILIPGIEVTEEPAPSAVAPSEPSDASDD